MNIYDKINRMSDAPGTYEEKLYSLVYTDKYKHGIYEVTQLGEGMCVVNENISGWWKPRFLLNNNTRCAYEIMDSNYKFVLITDDDIDWKSICDLSDDLVNTVKRHSFMFPSFIRPYQNGVALVTWQLNPDGRYYMDDDGYGMTNDEEVEIYGYIDQEGNVLAKFQTLKSTTIEKMRKEAEMKVLTKH